MDSKVTELKAAFAAAVGLLTGLWGWMGWLVVARVLDHSPALAAAREPVR